MAFSPMPSVNSMAQNLNILNICGILIMNDSVPHQLLRENLLNFDQFFRLNYTIIIIIFCISLLSSSKQQREMTKFCVYTKLEAKI